MITTETLSIHHSELTLCQAAERWYAEHGTEPRFWFSVDWTDLVDCGHFTGWVFGDDAKVAADVAERLNKRGVRASGERVRVYLRCE